MSASREWLSCVIFPVAAYAAVKNQNQSAIASLRLLYHVLPCKKLHRRNKAVPKGLQCVYICKPIIAYGSTFVNFLRKTSACFFWRKGVEKQREIRYTIAAERREIQKCEQAFYMPWKKKLPPICAGIRFKNARARQGWLFMSFRKSKLYVWAAWAK